MTLSTFVVSVAFASLWAAHIISAVPQPSNYIVRSLFKRDQVVFQDCGGDDDPKQVKAVGALEDAVTLATFTIEGKLDDGTEFQGTNAFSHYFEDVDSTNVTNMFGNIQAGSSQDRGNGFQLKVIISCAGTTNNCDRSFAVTDVAPITDSFTPTIRLCPLFFTSPETANFLGSREAKRNPTRRDNSWCQPSQPFIFFETAGHTLLHEMTHLDQLGQAAGLSLRDTEDENVQTHGTDDIYAIANGFDAINPAHAARQLKDDWATYNNDNEKEKPVLQRIENAEGFAASATEFYFQSKCGWDVIED